MIIQEQAVFAQRYILTKMLGRGGFSEVWLAVDKWTNLDVAIKIYAPGKGMDEDGMKDFCKELANVYNINHTNLVKPQHVDSFEGMPYLVMTYCSRGSCHRQIGQMKENDIWKLIADVASGLAYLHERAIIHQDIKPDNILIDDGGNYVITDFGISVQTRETMRKSMASGANASGTRAYMGPERFSKNPKPIPASDIWSLGATVYELLTGRVPFGEIGGGMQSAGASLPTITAPISPTLSQVIARMLAEDPEDRPSASLLADWAQNPEAVNLVIDADWGGNAGTALLKVKPSAAEIEPSGGEFTLFVKSEDDWKIYMTPVKWLTVSQRDTSVVLNVKPNQTGAERHHEISIVAGARAVSIPIHQKSLPKSKLKYLLIGAIATTALILSAVLINVKIHNENDYGRAEEAYKDYYKSVTVFRTLMDDAGGNISWLKDATGKLADVEGYENNIEKRELCQKHSDKLIKRFINDEELNRKKLNKEQLYDLTQFKCSKDLRKQYWKKIQEIKHRKMEKIDSLVTYNRFTDEDLEEMGYIRDMRLYTQLDNLPQNASIKDIFVVIKTY